MSNNLTGQFIANTFQNLIQMPDVTKQEFFNGIGDTISVINKDGIGTIKMFYPPSGNILEYFDNSGDGIVGGEWEGWKICDGNGSTPDLRGRFIVGYDPTGSSGFTYSIGATGGQIEMPQHSHDYQTIDWTDYSDGVSGTDGRKIFSRFPTTIATNNAGTGVIPDENRPPYYTLLYVLRVA